MPAGLGSGVPENGMLVLWGHREGQGHGFEVAVVYRVEFVVGYLYFGDYLTNGKNPGFITGPKIRRGMLPGTV